LLCRIELPRIISLRYPGDGSDSILNLRVAIRAQQDALADLRTQTLDAAGHSFLGHAELLGAWIKVMELQGGVTSVIAAKQTTSSSLRDEDLLDPAATTHHGLPAALPAPKIAAAIADVPSHPMAWTIQRYL
jgi:hypothetical protein